MNFCDVGAKSIFLKQKVEVLKFWNSDVSCILCSITQQSKGFDFFFKGKN